MLHVAVLPRSIDALQAVAAIGEFEQTLRALIDTTSTYVGILKIYKSKFIKNISYT